MMRWRDKISGDSKTPRPAATMLSKLSKLFPSVKKLGSNPASRWQTVRTRCIYSSPASVQGVKKLSSRKSASFGLARLAGQRCSAQAIEKEQRNKGVTVSDSLSARSEPAYPIPNMMPTESDGSLPLRPGTHAPSSLESKRMARPCCWNLVILELKAGLLNLATACRTGMFVNLSSRQVASDPIPRLPAKNAE